MTKKKVILVAAAALFAVSGLTALPSGNITGGAGCIVVAAVCAYFGLKKKSAGKENGNRTPAPAAASGIQINCSIFVIDLIYEIYYTINDNNCLHIEMLQYGFR